MKRHKRLKLNRRTIRELSASDIAVVGGGLSFTCSCPLTSTCSPSEAALCAVPTITRR